MATINDLDVLPELRPDAYLHCMQNGRDYKIPLGNLFGTSKIIFVNATLDTAGKFIATTDPALTAYSTGIIYIVIFDTLPAAANTLNIDGLGEIILKKVASGTKVDVASSDFQLAIPMMINYDGADFTIFATSSITSGTKDSSFVVNELGAQTFERRSILPAANAIADPSIAPVTEVNGDIFILQRIYIALDIDSIEWVSGTAHDVKYIITGNQDQLNAATVNDWIEIVGSTVSKHNGRFQLSAIDTGAGWFKIVNPLVSNATDDEAAGSPASADITNVNWDTTKINDWTRFSSSNGKWNSITPFAGQNVFDKSGNHNWNFNGTSWIGDVAQKTGLLEVEIPITSAEWLAIYTTPKVAAIGVAGKIAVPVLVWYETNNPGSFAAYATNKTMLIKHRTASEAIISNSSVLAATAQKTSYLQINGTSNSFVKGDDLIITTQTGNPTAGNFDITLHILYQLQTPKY